MPMIISKSQNERLREARIQCGFTTAAAAIRHFGWSASTYRHHENGTRGFGSEEAFIYARAFGVTANWLLCLDDVVMTEGVPVIASAAIGIWRDISIDAKNTDDGKALLVPKTASSNVMRFAVQVLDKSIDRLVPERAFVICRTWEPESDKLANGSYVFIEQSREGLVERSVRLVESIRGNFKLRTNSTNSALSNSVDLSTNVRIVGTVVGVYFDV